MLCQIESSKTAEITSAITAIFQLSLAICIYPITENIPKSHRLLTEGADTKWYITD